VLAARAPAGSDGRHADFEQPDRSRHGAFQPSLIHLSAEFADVVQIRAALGDQVGQPAGAGDLLDQLAAGRPFPDLAEFKPEPGLHDVRQLVIWNVEGAGRLQKFRAAYQGESVAEAFNSMWQGKTMEQVVPMSLRRVTLSSGGAAPRPRAEGDRVSFPILVVGI